MTLIVAVLCLLAQRWLHFYSYPYRIDWSDPYLSWMRRILPSLWLTSGWAFAALLLVPIFIVTCLLFIFVSHFLTVVGYFLLTLVVFWYALDYREFYFPRVFGVLFWLLVLGPVMVVFYIATLELHDHARHDALQDALGKIVAILDWVPVRLLGLTFALAGHFSATLKLWLRDFQAQPTLDYTVLDNWSAAAVEREDLATLVDRAVVIWLVVAALVTIGIWLG